MIIDGTDLETIGLIVDDRGRSKSGARAKLAIGQAPFAFRRFIIGRAALLSKRITLRAAVVTDNQLSRAAGRTQLATRLDNLKWRLRPDVDHILRWTDDEAPLREWLVQTDVVEQRDFIPGWVTPHQRIDLILTAEDPRARARVVTTRSDPGATPRLVEFPSIGNAPMPAIITIVGNAGANLTTPSLNYRDSANLILTTLTFTGTPLTGTDTLVVNLETFGVTLNGANAVDDITGDFFEIDPDDGDFLSGLAADHPDITLTAVSGTADTFDVAFRERYW